MSYTNPSPDTGPRVTREQMRDISTLRRAPAGQRMVGGVAEGLSRHFDVDPLLIRVLFGALTLFGGAGLVLYAIAWITIPEAHRHDSPMSSALRRDPARVMVGGLAIAGVVAAVTMVGAIGFSAPNPFPVVVISVLAIAIFAVFSRRADRQAPPPYQAPMYPASTYPSAPPTAMTAPAEGETTMSTQQESGWTDVLDDEPMAPPAPPREWWQRPTPPSGGGPYPPPGSFYPPPPPPVRQPKGHLFAITMALVAIALGIVWIADQATGDDFAASVYPGTALTIIAGALIVGAWYGKSRLLIVAGILATLATVGAQVLGPGPYGERVYRPTSAESLRTEYEHGVGRMVVHLEDIADRKALSGQTIDIDQRIGQLEVIVPSTMAVVIEAHVEHGEIDGPPRSDISDLDQGTEEITMSSVPAGGQPDLILDLDLELGQIRITQYNCLLTDAANHSTGLDTHSHSGVINAAPACN